MTQGSWSLLQMEDALSADLQSMAQGRYWQCWGVLWDFSLPLQVFSLAVCAALPVPGHLPGLCVGCPALGLLGHQFGISALFQVWHRWFLRGALMDCRSKRALHGIIFCLSTCRKLRLKLIIWV